MSAARVVTNKKKGVNGSKKKLPVLLAATTTKSAKAKKSSITSNKTKKTTAVTFEAADEKLVYTGYFRQDQPMSEHMRTMFNARVALLEAQLRLDHKDEENWTRQRIHEVARETAIGEFFEISRAPFGRKRGIAFKTDSKNNIVQYAASVWTAQYPGDTIRPADLMAQTQARFNVGKRRIRFEANLNGMSIQDIQNLVIKTMYERGSTTRSDAYRRFVRKENLQRFKQEEDEKKIVKNKKNKNKK